MTIYNELRPLFNPKVVAVIGASREPGKIGSSVFKTFLESKTFKGKVYPVNPKAKEILGRRCFSSILNIRKPVDLAVIAVPAKVVPFVMHECAEKKVKTAVIITSGFGEIGRGDLEAEVRFLAKEGGIRIVGTNCLGVFDAYSGVDTLFLPEEKLGRPNKGNISFISQSGAVGSVILDLVASEGFGVSKFVSYGNAADLTEADFIEYLKYDKATDVICVYLEGTKDGRRLMRVAKETTKEKPVVIIKAGKTEAGTRAVSSHTGSLAGADAVYDAAFKQCGILRANDVLEMFDFAQALSKQPIPKKNRIMIMTNGGGFGVLAADEIISRGMKLAEIEEKTKKKIKKAVPRYGTIHNPLDLVGDADPKRYEIALNALMKDKNVDAILCIALFQTVSMEPKVVDVIKKFNKKSKKPIVVCSAGGEYVEEQVRKIEASGVPVFDTPARAASALSALVRYGKIKK